MNSFNSILFVIMIVSFGLIFKEGLGIPHRHHHRYYVYDEVNPERNDTNNSTSDTLDITQRIVNTQNGTQQKRPTNFVVNKPGFQNVDEQPIDLQNVTRGVSTILNGVGSFRLSEILRGSFMFTRNERVRTVANSVLDSIFGKRDEALVNNTRSTPLLQGF